MYSTLIQNSSLYIQKNIFLTNTELIINELKLLKMNETDFNMH